MEDYLEIVRDIIEDYYDDKELSDSVLGSAEIDNAEIVNDKFIIYCEHPEELIMSADNLWETLQNRFKGKTDLIICCAKS